MRTVTWAVVTMCAYIADLMTPHLPPAWTDAAFYVGLAFMVHWLISLGQRE